MKKLIPAFALLLVSAVLMSTASFAWFSMNRTVTATNLQVKAVASSSLVIAQNLKVGALTTTAYSTAAAELIPATRDTTVGATTNLKYNTNPEVVDAHSGWKTGETDATGLTFADAINDDGNNKLYYVDYICYVASAGDKIENQKLVAHLYRDAGIPDNTQRAVSVDFYVTDETIAANADLTDRDNLGTYAGTLVLNNLAKDATSGEFRTGTIDITVPGNEIPVNNSNTDYIKIVMRIYFDGSYVGDRYELTKDTALDGTKTYYTWNSTNGVFETVGSPDGANIGNYYEKQSAGTLVYTDCASLTEIAFNVRFTAEAAS